MGITYLSGMLKPAMPVYFPGGQVTGVVRIQLDSTTSIRNVLVDLSGIGNVSWSEGGSGEHRRTYSSREVYIQQEIIVLRGTEAGGEMQAGVYELPFSFTLPQNIPSSFEGPHGHVRYTITTTADRKLQLDTTHAFSISVCTLYDLNTNPQARTPFSIDKSDSSCILCCASGPVHVTLYSDRSGFVPGETMIVNGEVQNKGSLDVTSTHLEILQVVVHKIPDFAWKKTRTSYRQVQSVTRGGIVGGRSISWNNVTLSIPSVVPTNLEHCNIMEVSYLVKFSAKFSMCRAVSETQTITIGSIPFSAGPGSPPNMEVPPMPTSFQLYGVNDMGVETTVSYTSTGNGNNQPFGNIVYNGQGPYAGLSLYVAPSLFKSADRWFGSEFAPNYGFYASPLRHSVLLQN